MSNHPFQYPFSAYVAGILSYPQLHDALKNFLLDYPRHAKGCQQQALSLLANQLINQQQLHALETIITSQNNASSIYDKNINSLTNTSAVPAITNTATATNIRIENAARVQCTLATTPTYEIPSIPLASPRLSAPTKNNHHEKNSPRYYLLFFLAFSVGSICGYGLHKYQSMLTLLIQPQESSTVLTTTNLSMPTSATAADSNQSVNDRDKLSPSIQPPSSQHPQQNLAQADALLTELKQQQNSHNTNPEQARQRLAQTYLQLARDARQQKQWQQAEAFLAKSIEMRIDQIDDSELISPKAGDHSNKDLME